jgi:hypothetical protein
MKIKVKAILRSPELTADPGDVIIVDEKTGNLLINADAAELVPEVVEVETELVKIVEIEPIKAEAETITPEIKEVALEQKEEPKPIKRAVAKKW